MGRKRLLSWCHPFSTACKNSPSFCLLLREGDRARLRARWWDCLRPLLAVERLQPKAFLSVRRCWGVLVSRHGGERNNIIPQWGKSQPFSPVFADKRRDYEGKMEKGRGIGKEPHPRRSKAISVSATTPRHPPTPQQGDPRQRRHVPTPTYAGGEKTMDRTTGFPCSTGGVTCGRCWCTMGA